MISSPEDRKKLKQAIEEISNSMTRVEAEKDFQKEAIANICDKIEIDKKYVKKLATIYHRNTISQVKTETSDIEALYTEIFESNPQ
jgi:archaellum component FlaC